MSYHYPPPPSPSPPPSPPPEANPWVECATEHGGGAANECDTAAHTSCSAADHFVELRFGLGGAWDEHSDLEPAQIIERLYLSTLSRRPTAEESAESVAYTAACDEPAQAYTDVLWMLVNRSEFLFVR